MEPRRTAGSRGDAENTASRDELRDHAEARRRGEHSIRRTRRELRKCDAAESTRSGGNVDTCARSPFSALFACVAPHSFVAVLRGSAAPRDSVVHRLRVIPVVLRVIPDCSRAYLPTSTPRLRVAPITSHSVPRINAPSVISLPVWYVGLVKVSSTFFAPTGSARPINT